jgi:hypothetical protein
MLKNIVISVILSFCAVLAVHSIFFENQDNIMDRNFSALHRTERINAVKTSEFFKIAVVYNQSEWIDRLLVDSIQKVADAVNSRGGINGKKLELKIQTVSGDQIGVLAKIQTVCSPKDVAVCIGPFSSDFVVSARSITTFSSVPLLSPTAVYSEKLRSLDNDSYATVFPPLSELVNTTLIHMRGLNIDELVIVCPENGTYGDLYSTLLERYGQQIGGFTVIHRLTYQTPFNDFAVSSALKSVLSHRQFDAIFYAGGTADFDNFMAVYNALGISVPVYSTEVINTPAIRKAMYNTKIFIPFFNTDYLQANIELPVKIPLDENNPDLCFMAQWLMNAVVSYLEHENYDPVLMPAKIRKDVDRVYGYMDPRAAFFIDNISAYKDSRNPSDED